MTGLSPVAEALFRDTWRAIERLDDPVEALAALGACINMVLEHRVPDPSDRAALRACAQATLAEDTPAEQAERELQ